MNADRNLLFGILAFQNSFIDRRALLAAFDQWTADKNMPLGEILVEANAISADDHALLHALVGRHVEMHDNDPEKSLAAITPVGSVRDDLKRLADPDVEASLAHVSMAPMGRTLDATLSWTAGDSTSAGTRFRVLRPHARGGLGEVFVAEDQELHREVALKEIQEQHADNPDSRSRFLLEAEVTGGLEHPSIVPVYGLGSYSDGRPFYAMRFVKGDSLKEAVKRFHQTKAAGRDRTERTAELRKLLGRFIDVCNAIEYAHSRGVLHRDLKPGNIMLGNYGETLVVDWGLAKVMGRSEAHAEREEQTLHPSAASGSAATQMGKALGTPQYMSPEQAAGRWDELGPASDVYSLGATLYTLLTGRAPIGESESMDVLARAVKGDFPAPRTVDKEIPAALEAICPKAMALKPADRYGSPRALADDIERWLNDQPVSVHRDPFSRKLARWVRNHKGTAGAVAASVVVLVVGGILASAIARSVNERTEIVTQVKGLVESLVKAETQQVPEIVKQLSQHPTLARPLLVEKLAQAKDDSTEKLHLSLALVGNDEGQVEYLYEQLLRAEPAKFPVIRDALADHSARISDRLWTVLASHENDPQPQRLRAAGALAKYDQANARWSEVASEVADQLVSVNPVFLGQWQAALRGVDDRLLPPLAKIFNDPEQNELPRTLATSLLADYAKDDPDILTNVVIDADSKAFGVLFPVLQSHQAAVEKLQAVLDRKVEPTWHDPPLDSAWTEPPAAARAAIEAAHGILAERFAFCQDLAWDEFAQLAESLRASDYRPTRVRPWAHRGKLLVAAVWTRDGKRWELETDLAREQLPQGDAPAEKDGLMPTDLAVLASVDPAAEPRFVLVWGDAATGERRRLVVDAIEQQLVAVQAAMVKQGFAAQSTIGVWTDTAGQRHYLGIWSNQGAPSELRAAYGGFELVDQPQWDVAVAPAGRLADPLDGNRRELADFAKLSPAQLDQPQVRLSRAVNNYMLGNAESSLSDLDFLESKGDSSPRVSQFRAMCLARLGKVDEARRAFGKYAEATSYAPMRSHVRVQVEAWLGEFEQAIHELDSAATASDEDPNGLFDIAAAAALSAEAFPKTDAKRSVFEDRAVDLLQRLADKGSLDAKQVCGSSDLANLHGNANFLALVERLEPPARYAAVWRVDVEFESRLVEPASPESQLEQARALAAQGYRPVSTCVLGQGVLTDGSQTSPVVSTVWHRPLVPDAAKEELAERQATAAVALLRMGEAKRVWPLFEHQPDPRLRSYLVDRLVGYGVDPAAMLARLQTESDVSRRRALILGIGQLARAKLFPDQQQSAAVAVLSGWYAEDADGGIHGASEWALRQLGAQAAIAQVRQASATGSVVGERQWYLTKEGAQTLVIVHPEEKFLMGSPVAEAERFQGPTGKYEIRHRRRIGRTFAIGAHEVTVEQFQRFRAEHSFDRTKAREPDAPANLVTWYEAAAFCNWLSEQEGIGRDQWCYNPDQPFGDGMVLYPDYLRRAGYRLPSEAEWEYACRAGATTARYFGETPGLLGECAWYQKNSQDRWMLSVGSLKPNDLGLFDTLGNAVEWCQDAGLLYSQNRAWMDDREQAGAVRDLDQRVLRGGAFYSVSSYVCSAYRYTIQPWSRLNNLGFRVARTYP